MKTRSSPCEGRQREDYFATRHPGRSSPYGHSSSSWQVGKPSLESRWVGSSWLGGSRLKILKSSKLSQIRCSNMIVLTLLHFIALYQSASRGRFPKERCFIWGLPTVLNSHGFETSRCVRMSCLVKLWTWSLGFAMKAEFTKLFRLILLPKWIGAVWRFFVKMSLFRDSKMWNHFR